MFCGVSSNAIKDKTNLNDRFNRYLLSNKSETTSNGDLTVKIISGNFNDMVYGIYSGVPSIKVNLNIEGGIFRQDIIGSNVSNTDITMTLSRGTFRGHLIGNAQVSDTKGEAIIIINGNINVTDIINFTKLQVGSGNNRGTLSGVYKLDKGSLKGDLYLSSGSKITFTKDVETSNLNDIVLNGDATFELVSPIDRDKDNVLMNLSGHLKNNGNRLNP